FLVSPFMLMIVVACAAMVSFVSNRDGGRHCSLSCLRVGLLDCLLNICEFRHDLLKTDLLVIDILKWLLALLLGWSLFDFVAHGFDLIYDPSHDAKRFRLLFVSDHFLKEHFMNFLHFCKDVFHDQCRASFGDSLIRG